jgi:proline iminopeptidase
MELLRNHLGIEHWQLLGGSWGSALALAVGQTHPERVTELILRGIFTLRRSEIEWFYQEGCSWIYPDAFEAYLAPIPEDERHDMISAYYKRLTGDDPAICLEAARAWSVWEGSTLSLLPNETRVKNFANEEYALAFARIECHYFVNRGFLDSDDQLIANAHLLQDIPGIIVHGRYDVVTPLKTAWELVQAWPKAQLKITPDSGHAMTEPGNAHELVSATRYFGPDAKGS